MRSVRTPPDEQMEVLLASKTALYATIFRGTTTSPLAPNANGTATPGSSKITLGAQFKVRTLGLRPARCRCASARARVISSHPGLLSGTSSGAPATHPDLAGGPHGSDPWDPAALYSMHQAQRAKGRLRL